MQQWPHHQNLRHSAGFHGFHAHSPWVVNGWNASNAVRKWRTWRSRAGCSARFWPRRDWIGWCICRICEWGRRRGVRIRRRRWWRTIEWAAMCSIWRSRGREAGWAWRRWTRRLWFLIFACSLECLFENRVEEGSWMGQWVREWLVVRTRNTQCKDKRMSILAFVWRNTWRFQKWSSLSNSNLLPFILPTFLSPTIHIPFLQRKLFQNKQTTLPLIDIREVLPPAKSKELSAPATPQKTFHRLQNMRYDHHTRWTPTQTVFSALHTPFPEADRSLQSKQSWTNYLLCWNEWIEAFR